MSEKVYVVYMTGKTMTELGSVFSNKEAAEKNCAKIMKGVSGMSDFKCFVLERDLFHE